MVGHSEVVEPREACQASDWGLAGRKGNCAIADCRMMGPRALHREVTRRWLQARFSIAQHVLYMYSHGREGSGPVGVVGGKPKAERASPDRAE